MHTHALPVVSPALLRQMILAWIVFTSRLATHPAEKCGRVYPDTKSIKPLNFRMITLY